MRYLFVAIIIAALMTFVGCGGNSPQTGPTPSPTPPTPAFTNASLNGQYAFVLSNPSVAAGSFQADGNGNITHGTMDISAPTDAGGLVSFTGTYNVLPNGEGTAALRIGSPVLNLHFFFISKQHLLVTNFFPAAGSIFGTGSIDLQDPTAFSAAALKGQYAFYVQGEQNMVGGFILDGVSAISSGVHDGVNVFTNAAGENLPLTGNYSVSADNSGRGTLTLNTFAGVQTIAFYIVSKGHLMLMETAPLIAAGEAFTGFDPSPQNPGCGTCVFLWSANPSFPEAHVGIFTHDAAGNITGGNQDSSFDNGVFTHESITGGSMTFGPQFRTQMTLIIGGQTNTVAAYPSNGGVFLLRKEFQPLAGVALNQSSGVPLNHSLEGTYGFEGSFSLLGQFTTLDPGDTGSGTLLGSVVDGAAPEASVNGSFAMDATGRGTVNLGQDTYTVRALDNTKLLFINPGARAGIMELQAAQ